MIILLGADGMLGSMLAKQMTGRHLDFLPFTYPAVDVTRPETLKPLAKLSPSTIINATGYTAVDLAESEPEKAFAVNADGVKALALFAKEVGARLVHFSTDYVFSGDKSQGYIESDMTAPQSVYGKSKLAGEAAVAQVMDPTQWIILRSAWLYGPNGKNFVQTMLNLAANNVGAQGKDLRVVNDQIGCPTYTVDLSSWTLDLLSTNASGIFHAVNSGTCSWFEFATTIFAMKNMKVKVTPVTSDAYPTAAKRPAFSILDNRHLADSLKYNIRKWPEALSEFLASSTL